MGIIAATLTVVILPFVALNALLPTTLCLLDRTLDDFQVHGLCDSDWQMDHQTDNSM